MSRARAGSWENTGLAVLRDYFLIYKNLSFQKNDFWLRVWGRENHFFES